MIQLKSLALEADVSHVMQIRLLDQTLLPHQEKWLVIETAEQMIEAIQSLRVRGAPLIGIAASLMLGKLALEKTTTSELLKIADQLYEARPTAVNLMICIDRMKKVKEFHYTIKGYDKAPSAVQKAKDNVRNANLDEYISIEEKNFFDTEKTSQGKLHMVFNPPYDERLDIHMEEFYKNIGDTLKKNYPGTNAWFITANLEALKFVGLKPSRKIKLFNGSLEARLVKYEMYEGSKRTKFQTQEDKTE